MFDVLVFEVDEATGKSADFECYKQAVYTKLWNTECNFGDKTNVTLKLDRSYHNLKSLEDSNDKDRIIVIDNTPLPLTNDKDRYSMWSKDNIVLEYAVSSTFNMSYNLRNVSIVMGIFSMIISFAIGALSYLSFKIKKDIDRKFLSDDDEEEEEEEEDKVDEKTDASKNLEKVALNE